MYDYIPYPNLPYELEEQLRQTTAIVRYVVNGDLYDAAWVDRELADDTPSSVVLTQPGIETDVSEFTKELFSFDLYAWKKLQADLERFLELPDDWDGMGSNALGRETVRTAGEALKICQELCAEPEWVIPTTDQTVMFQCLLPDGQRIQLEIQDPAAIGVARTRPDSATTFHDATLDNLRNVLSA